MEKIRRTIIAINIFLLLLSGAACAGPGKGTVSFKGRHYNVEVARTEDERSRGLMFRERLDPDSGMLFIFEEEMMHPFWMKNTLIPLDMIWLDKDKEVVFIAASVQPGTAESYTTITPGVNAKYVLEFNSGTAEEIGLAVGSKLRF